MTQDFTWITFLVEETEKMTNQPRLSRVTRLFSRWCLWCSSVAVWIKRDADLDVFLLFRCIVLDLCSCLETRQTHAEFQANWFKGSKFSLCRGLTVLILSLEISVRLWHSDPKSGSTNDKHWLVQRSCVDERRVHLWMKNWTDNITTDPRLLKAGMFLLNSEIFIFGESNLSLSSCNL